MTPTGTSFNHPIPQIPQATFSVSVSARDASDTGGYFYSLTSTSRRGLGAGSNNTSLVLQDIPHLNQPVNQATGVTSTTDFSWTAFSGGVHTLGLDKTDESGAPFTIHVTTADTHTPLPDLTALGLPPLAAGTSFSWSVTGTGPLASVDAYLDPGNSTPDSTYATSALWTFTLAKAP